MATLRDPELSDDDYSNTTYDKPLWKVLFQGKEITDLDSVGDSLLLPTEHWVSHRNAKGDIQEIDPELQSRLMDILALLDNNAVLESRIDEKKNELEGLTHKLETAAKAMLDRQCSIMRGEGIENPEETDKFKHHFETIQSWKSDKHQLANKVYLAMLDERKGLKNRVKELAGEMIQSAYSMYMVELKKTPAPCVGQELPARVDPDLFRELEALDLSFEVGVPKIQNTYCLV